MNVASLELCKELYELSGWGDTDFIHSDEQVKSVELLNHDGKYSYGQLWDDVNEAGYSPAYTLGFLLRKLPDLGEANHWSFRLEHDHWDDDGLVWSASYVDNDDNDLSTVADLIANAPNPTDATCKLAIELFKSGVLKRGEA